MKSNAHTGDVTVASRMLNAFYLVWRDWGFLPEQFNHEHWKLQDNGVGRVSVFCVFQATDRALILLFLPPKARQGS